MNGNKGKVYLFQHIKTKLNEEEKKLDDMMKKLRTKFSRVGIGQFGENWTQVCKDNTM